MRDAEIGVRIAVAGSGEHAEVFVLPGTTVAEAAALAGVVIDAPCGGAGSCGKCRVRFGDAGPTPTEAERRAFAEDELQAGWRLACQAALTRPATVEVPLASRLAGGHKILTRTSGGPLAFDDPPVRAVALALTPPARGDDASDVARLHAATGPFTCGLEMLRELPARLRADNFRGWAVLAGDELIDLRHGPRCPRYSVAVDVGTTTIAAALIDMENAEVRHVVSRLNPQTRFGDDVLSRIVYARGGLAELQRAVVEALTAMIGELTATAGAAAGDVYEIVVAGNTAMQHLLLGLDPKSLGEVPFVPAIGPMVDVAAAAVGLPINARGRLIVFPVIGGFVGGDTVAGILATDLDERHGPTLLVDIGTNGEIVLAAGGKLSAASTAAGPAFEGARIRHGMRGTTGAIEKVVFDGRLRLNIIDNAPAAGICGSGLIDLAAELLRHGALGVDGRLRRPEEVGAGLPRRVAERIVSFEGKPAFELVAAAESARGEAIVLTQRDVRELQLATGAIRAGIDVLLAREGLAATDLEEVLLAGGFGNYIRRSNAQRIGLLPHQIDRRRIRYQGNTSLAGAQLAAASVAARRRAAELAARTEHVDLALDPRFAAAFADAMLFPEG